MATFTLEGLPLIIGLLIIIFGGERLLEYLMGKLGISTKKYHRLDDRL